MTDAGSVGGFPRGAQGGHGGGFAGAGRADEHVDDPPGGGDLLDRVRLLWSTTPMPAAAGSGAATGPLVSRPAVRSRVSASRMCWVV